MIRVQRQPEPPHFNATIRIPGNRFLKKVPHPNNNEWSKHRFWTQCRNDLYIAYQGICAYTAMWIPNYSCTVDHFIPKSIQQYLAYEWDNYRLACERANNNKQNLIILDPFSIPNDWFVLLFPSLQIVPNPTLQQADFKLVKNTIDILKLNESVFTQIRLSWLKEYAKSFDITFLQKYAPFIAYEVQRQGANQIITQMQ
jgi:hypothetical protein